MQNRSCTFEFPQRVVIQVHVIICVAFEIVILEILTNSIHYLNTYKH